MTKVALCIIFITLLVINIITMACIHIAGDTDILAEEQFRQFKLDRLRGKDFEN